MRAGAVLRLGGLALTVACGGPDPGTPAPAVEAAADTADALSLTSAEEIRAEIEMLGYEIGDLEAFVASAPAAGEPLAAARAGREAAETLLAAGDTAAAVDTLVAVHGRVEAVKRALGLAEEWGEEMAEDSLPAVSTP